MWRECSIVERIFGGKSGSNDGKADNQHRETHPFASLFVGDSSVAPGHAGSIEVPLQHSFSTKMKSSASNRCGATRKTAVAKKEYHRRTLQEKGWQIANDVFGKGMPCDEWYLLPTDQASSVDCRSVLDAFQDVTISEYLSLMVVCGFLKARGPKLVYQNSGLELMRGKYANLMLVVEQYRSRSLSAYFICRESKKGSAPSLKACIENQQSGVKPLRPCVVSMTLLNAAIKGVVLPSSTPEAINTSRSTDALEPNIVTPDASAGSNRESRPNVRVETVSEDECQGDKETEDNECQGHGETEDDECQGTVENIIEQALNLDFDVRLNVEGAEDSSEKLRPARQPGGKDIELTDRKMPTQAMRLLIVLTAVELGYEHNTSRSKATSEKNDRIIAAACNMIFYDFGYKKSSKATNFTKWYKEFLRSIYGNGSFEDVAATKKMGPKTLQYWQRIERDHPGFLRKMFRSAIKKVGPEAGWKEIAETMNELSEDYGEQHPAEESPVLTMNAINLRRWFKAKKGRLRKRHARSILTPERKAARKEWAKNYDDKLEAAKNGGPAVYVAFLDEKWFFTRSGRKKAKWLPPEGDETWEDAKLPVIRTADRRRGTPVMAMGVCAAHGQVDIIRVSKWEKAKRGSHNRHFSIYVKKNEEIKRSWKTAVANEDSSNMKAKDIIQAVVDKFSVNEYVEGLEVEGANGDCSKVKVADRLVLRFNHWGTANKSVKTVPANKMLRDNKIRTAVGEAVRPLTLDDIELFVEKKKNDRIETDCNCDGDFMLSQMDRIGNSIRQSFSSIPVDTVIDLCIDNAGGHGSEDKIAEYEDYLLEKYKIKLVRQIPRSMEFNMLDLGVWMSVQSAVEKSHRGRRSNRDALWFTIRQAWEALDTSVFNNVHARWKKVLKIVIATQGDNDLVDSARGEFYSAIILPLYEETIKALAEQDPAVDEFAENEDEDIADEQQVGTGEEQEVEYIDDDDDYGDESDNDFAA